MSMRLILSFVARIIANAIGILIAGYFVPGIIFNFKGDLIDDLTNLVITGFILAIANAIIKPILKFITGPLIVLTMGLFLVIINIIILWLVDWFMPELTIVGIQAYFWGVIIISIINAIVTGVSKKRS